MRMRRLPSLGSGRRRSGRRRSARRIHVAGVAVLVVAALLLVAGASGADQPEGTAAGWESLLGDRPSAQLGGRWIVVLAKPSLASRVAAAGGIATEEQERAWTAAARAAQREVLTRLAFKGAPIEPEHAYYRVFNGFATPLDARTLAIAVRDPDVKGVFPVRAAIPAAVDPGSVDELRGIAGGRRPDVGIPGFSGAGVTVALLDTGVDLVHPYIRGALIKGLDVLDPGATRAPGRIRPRREGRSATAPRWRASSQARAGLTISRASPPVPSCFRSEWRGGSRIPREASPSTAAPISFSPGSSSRSTPTRTVTPTMRRASPSWVSSSRSRRSPTARSPPPQPARPRSTRSWSRRPATTGRQALPTAASAARAEPPRRSPPARSTRDAVARPATSCCSRGFVSSSPASSRSVGWWLRRSRCRRRSSRCRRRLRPWSARPAGSPASSTATATAASRGRPYCSRAGHPHPRPLARSSRPARVRCSSMGRSRQGRSAPTVPPTSRSSGCCRPMRMPSARRCGARFRSRSPSARPHSTRTRGSAVRRRSRPRGSRSTAAQSPR